jgi:thiopurine S-methyltransferase
MQQDFWHQKWQKNEIGFHLSTPNPLLVKHLKALKLQQGACVFLPLCGKTVDIAWLLAQGYQVVGAELSEIAIHDLFQQLQITPVITQLGDVANYHAADIDIFVGDIFKLTPAMLQKIDAVYDRAALVALPEEMRVQYTTHLRALTNNAPQLLICFEYDQSIHAGPPFSISADEVSKHYQSSHLISLLASQTMPDGLKGQYPATELAWYLGKSSN